MDELCISKRRNLWLWTAVSRYTGQILAYLIGDRTWKHAGELHALLPQRYQRRRVYTDGYEGR
jgi:IS1 family transposase